MSEPAASTGDAASGRVAAAALIEAMVQDGAGTQRVRGRYPEGTGFLRSALNEPWIVSRGLAANLVPRDPKHADPWRTPASHRKDAIVLDYYVTDRERDHGEPNYGTDREPNGGANDAVEPK